MTTVDALWRVAMEHSPLGATVAGVDGRMLLVNPAFCTMLGYEESALTSMDFRLITHPDDRRTSAEALRRAARGEVDSYRTEKRYLHADGSVVWADLSVVLVRDDEGEPRYVVAQVVDVSASHRDRVELARAVRALERERALAEAILDSVDVGLVLIDSEGVYERMNRRHHDFLALAYPHGHAHRAGQVGLVYAADGTTVLTSAETPSARATRGEEFDDLRIWVGDDPLTRRALAVSARSVRDDTAGGFAGAALAYVDVTALLSALQVQQTFLGAVSHELRTPLTPILGHLELLEEQVDLAPEWAPSLAVMRRSAVRLERLVSDLLLETQLQAHGLELDRRDVDLGALACEAVQSASLAASRAGLRFEVDVRGPVTCFADPERVRQVLDNVVTNALKYADGPGCVTVTCRASAGGTPGRAEVVVADTGIGIAPEALAHVFDPFYRASQAVSREASGLGLGLGIVRAIMGAHGGEVRVSSELGRGTTVHLEFPTRARTHPGVATRLLG